MILNFSTRVRRAVALVAVLALSLLLLRSACDVLALPLPDSHASAFSSLHHDSKADEALTVGSHAGDFAAPAAGVKGLLVVLPYAIGMALAVAALAFLSRAAPASAAPLPTRSYYLRSARILR